MQSKDQKVFSSRVIIGRGDTFSIQQIMEKINCKTLILKTKAILKFPLAHQVIDEFYSRRMADCNLGQIRLFNKGPFIYYVITCRGGEGGQKMHIFNYFQY